MCDNIFFLTTSTRVGLRAPAGRPGLRQSGRWPHPSASGERSGLFYSSEITANKLRRIDTSPRNANTILTCSSLG